jgi:uncharacterized protein (DUF2235 family)
MGNLIPPQKRLALFLDGTWNDEGDNTNVWRLRSLCATTGTAGIKQYVYYDTGLGTHVGEKLRGGLYGFGVDESVRKAYEWLVENYDDGDEIYIFGFSRGAFTARSLAGLISICGILRPGTPLGVGQLYLRYQHVDRNADSIRNLFDAQHIGKLVDPSRETLWLLKYSRRAEITMVGVWDTVAAIDLPLVTKHHFLDPNLRHDLKNAFHALAIDERRHRFGPTLWKQTSLKSDGPPMVRRDYAAVEQRWFIGAHANVGGGYPSDLLSQIPLKWMLQKAEALGLAFRGTIDVEAAASVDPVTDSYGPFLEGTYRLVSQPYNRPIGVPDEESDGYLVRIINETIDDSVFDRWRRDPSYRPDNLKDWATRHSVDPASLTHAVRADAPLMTFSHAEENVPAS